MKVTQRHRSGLMTLTFRPDPGLPFEARMLNKLRGKAHVTVKLKACFPGNRTMKFKHVVERA